MHSFSVLDSLVSIADPDPGFAISQEVKFLHVFSRLFKYKSFYLLTIPVVPYLSMYTDLCCQCGTRSKKANLNRIRIGTLTSF
jgi:hypothetical protein